MTPSYRLLIALAAVGTRLENYDTLLKPFENQIWSEYNSGKRTNQIAKEFRPELTKQALMNWLKRKIASGELDSSGRIKWKPEFILERRDRLDYSEKENEIETRFFSGNGQSPNTIAKELNKGIRKEDKQYLPGVIREILIRKLGQAKYDEQMDVIKRGVQRVTDRIPDTPSRKGPNIKEKHAPILTEPEIDLNIEKLFRNRKNIFDIADTLNKVLGAKRFTPPQIKSRIVEILGKNPDTGIINPQLGEAEFKKQLEINRIPRGN